MCLVNYGLNGGTAILHHELRELWLGSEVAVSLFRSFMSRQTLFTECSSHILYVLNS